MQWILQEFDDTRALADVLERRGILYTWHRVVPFVGDLEPEPEIADPNAVVLFGAYTLWRYAEKRRLKPGVFKLRPFVHETVWQPYLLNGINAQFLQLKDIPDRLQDDGQSYFVRPVDDSKEEPGQVKSVSQIIATAEQVLTLELDEIPEGSLRHDTELMLTRPVQIHTEWRVWIIDRRVRTYSLYRERSRVIYRSEIDDDALEFANEMAKLNPDYAGAYVLDICRTDEGLKIIETNCINAAGFYAADLTEIVNGIESLATA